MGLYDYTAQTADNVALGKGGSNYISNTTAVTGTFSIISVIEDCKFSVLTDATRDNTVGATSRLADTTAASCLVIPAGTTLYGTFTAITLHSGVVIAYKG